MITSRFLGEPSKDLRLHPSFRRGFPAELHGLVKKWFLRDKDVVQSGGLQPSAIFAEDLAEYAKVALWLYEAGWDREETFAAQVQEAAATPIGFEKFKFFPQVGLERVHLQALRKSSIRFLRRRSANSVLNPMRSSSKGVFFSLLRAPR